MDRERSIIVRITLLAVLAVGLTGCYDPEPRPRITGEQRRLDLPPARTPPPRQRVVGRSVQGRPIRVQIVGQGPETILIMATIHGNEPAGTPLVSRLVDHLQDHPHLLEGRQVVVMPVANPDGLAANTRENARGIDLNRNFETTNRVDNENHGLRPLTEPESQILQAIIKEYAPNRIVSIHQPLDCIDYDGPGQAIAARMAQNCDLPVKKLGARPGSLGSYTGDTLGIPTITLELPAAATKQSEAVLWQKYGRALLAAIVYPQLLP
ncbi:MAG: murein peptide amidase A [Planctomycetes bacterium]|nr:murein peptide amidase A [Planctomycetota bacterium]